MLAQVGDDELLEGTGAKWAVVTIGGEGHDLPVERGADQGGGPLALPERSLREIVERRLARRGLVDRERFCARLAANVCQVGVVGAVGHQPARLDLALAQQALLGLAIRQSRGAHHGQWCPLRRGQTPPSWSMGPPHIGQGGRPALMMAAAWAARACIWARLAWK